MTRIKLIPIITSDGRHVILQPVSAGPLDRLRELIGRLGRRRAPRG